MFDFGIGSIVSHTNVWHAHLFCFKKYHEHIIDTHQSYEEVINQAYSSLDSGVQVLVKSKSKSHNIFVLGIS